MTSAARIVDLAEFPADTTFVVTLREQAAGEGIDTGEESESGEEVEASSSASQTASAPG